MLKRRNSGATGRVDTLIGKQTVIEGKLSATGSVRIEGCIQGEVVGDANLVIGETGKLVANVQGKNIILSGEVRGNVVASGRTEITATGRLFGDLTTHALVIDEGALLQGNCLTEEKAKAGAVKPAAQPAPGAGEAAPSTR